jgi:hypothetical protein
MSIRAMRDRAYAKRVRAELAEMAAPRSNEPVDAFDLFATSEVKVRPQELEPQASSWITLDRKWFTVIWIDEAPSIDWSVLEKRIWGFYWTRETRPMIDWAYPGESWIIPTGEPKLLDWPELAKDAPLPRAEPWTGKVIDFEVEKNGLATQAPEWVGRQKNWSRNK